MKPECLTCKFFISVPNIDTPTGQCHRFPPTNGRFPLVTPGNWCGEFQLAGRAVEQQPVKLHQPQQQKGKR